MHLVALIMPLISIASATTFIERPLPETVQGASVVVRGTVQKSFADWGKSEDGARSIYTFTELQVSEVLRGQGISAPSTLQVRTLGGEKDGVGMQVSGTATFSPGEEVVVLLGEKNSDGSHDVESMMMGKFNLRPDDNGQEVLMGPGIPRGDGASKWTVQAFRDLVASQSPPKPEAAPSATAAAAGAPDRRQTPDAPAGVHSEAPRLQPSATEEASPATGLPSQLHLEWWSVLGVAAALLILVWFVRRGGKGR